MATDLTSTSSSIRVAFEGCGHGCLHDIYASVEKAATLKGWDGVDLLIIGGDFQAVRNSYDLTCMAVPPKYKEIGDFHEYYSGKRTAPYLTIFIGGNHEASNYLFELYYGGWVAPNIYYLGAANVLRCGPLRIAGLSGIWKGYDYRKPHFERLPYNPDDLQSIYHVRELDIRKLLQIRTQVDLGLSHDWPKQVELSGDYNTLFRIKRGFGEDSRNGRLGSSAAKYVLDRLRPAYWFSAHLHVKFAASVQHGKYVGSESVRQTSTFQSNTPQASGASHSFGLDGTITSVLLGDEDQPANPESSRTAPFQKDDELPEAPSHSLSGNDPVTKDTTDAPDAPDRHEPTSAQDHDLGDTHNRLSAWNDFHAVAAKNEAAENSRFWTEEQQQSSTSGIKHDLTWRKIDVDHDGVGRKLTGIERTDHAETSGSKKQKIQHGPPPVKNEDEINLDLNSDSDQEAPAEAVSETEAQKKNNALEEKATEDSHVPKPEDKAGVPEELRNQLPASFARPQPNPVIELPSIEPLPEAISNTTTNFLALDKCLPNRDFLQLMEFQTISDQEGVQSQRPYRLQYDKEWLAISRVFANDLQLGDPAARPPADKGTAVYRAQIEEEEKWIEEHVVKPGKLTVPENFTPTAPFYDPAISIHTDQIPPEYTNPQTSQFCELIGIENKFHLSDEERQARIEAGPRPSNFRSGGGGRGFRRGGGQGRGRGGGGYGHGRGRGRGRGNRHY